MQWVLVGVFIADATFFFRLLEVHQSEIGCLMGKEAITVELGKDKLNYGLICIKTDEIGETAL